MPIRRAPELAPASWVAGVLTEDVEAIQYTHKQDGKPYEHVFAAGVCLELLANGEGRLFRPDGQAIWDEFDVDGEDDDDDDDELDDEDDDEPEGEDEGEEDEYDEDSDP